MAVDVTNARACEQMKSVGQVLFDEVVRKLRLVESDYFDLEYTDVHGTTVSAKACSQNMN